MGLRLESRTGISTRWRDERVSPLAYFFSFRNVAMAASALTMNLNYKIYIKYQKLKK